MYPRLIERLSSVGSLKKRRGDLNNLTTAEVQGAGWIPDARAKFASAEPRRIFIWQPQSHGHCHYLRQAVLWKRATMDFKPALYRSHERGESLELLERFSWTYSEVAQGLYTDDCNDYWTHGSPNSACQLSGTDLTARMMLMMMMMMMKGCKWTFQVQNTLCLLRYLNVRCMYCV